MNTHELAKNYLATALEHVRRLEDATFDGTFATTHVVSDRGVALLTASHHIRRALTALGIAAEPG